MYLSIIFLPLAGFISAAFFGYYIGRNGSKILTTLFMFCSLLLSIYAFYDVGLLENPSYITLGSWINSELFIVNWGFLFDSLTVTMLIVVNSVSTLVHLYSCEYMKHDPHISRFMSYLSLFTFFMLILVTADNFIQMFLGWEGVGLCSYLLISFWFTRVQANKAALKALIMNRVGDCGFLLGVMIIFFTFRSVDFTTVFTLAPIYANKSFLFIGWQVDILTAICISLFIGSIGKSAQIGLHTWLPDAMEGPTPVSALIHAATMVTAGVFLIIRCSTLFEYSPVALCFVTVIGALTAFFAASIGIFQNDIKKIIAYSTCSQLGYMIFICGLSGYNISLFHLLNHAFFKALLFLSAGAIIHGCANEQDIRRMGGLRQLFPYTYAMLLIGSLALIGFPFLSGFYSKDLILEVAYARYSVSGLFAYWLGTISACCTAYYSTRLIYFTFLTDTNAFKHYITNTHEAPILMALPLFVLSVGSIFSGYFLRDLMVGPGSTFFLNSIYIKPENVILLDSEFIPVWIKLLPTILSLFSVCLAVYLNHWQKLYLTNLKLNFYKTYCFFTKKWYFDYIYNAFLGYPILYLAYNNFYKDTDKGLIEMFGPNGLTFAIFNLSKKQSRLQTGLIYNYLYLIFVIFVFWIVLLEFI